MVLSIGMIVKNEEKYLERCLTALKPILDKLDSELIIADTGSTDRTVEIAKRFTDNVFHFEWIGDFAAARNSTLERAQGEWYMFIDADEIAIDCTDIIGFFKSGEYKNYKSATYVIRSLKDLSDDSVTSESRFTRVVKRTSNIKFEGIVHENFSRFPKPTKHLNFAVDHYGYLFRDNDVPTEQAYEKSKRNLEGLLKELEDENITKRNPMVYSEIADCYGIVDNAEKALEYLNLGLEKVDHESMMIIPYYTHKLLELFDNDKYDEVIETANEYFDAEKHPWHNRENAHDCIVFYLRSLSYYERKEYKNAIADMIRVFDLYKKYTQNKLDPEDLLVDSFKLNYGMLKVGYDFFLHACYREKMFELANSYINVVPLNEFYGDADALAIQLLIRVEIMDNLGFNKLDALYKQLSEQWREHLLTLVRPRVFKADPNKRGLIIRKLASLGGKVSELAQIYKLCFENGGAALDNITRFLEKYGSKGSEDLLMIMMTQNLDITPFVCSRDFAADRTVPVLLKNYEAPVKVFEDYDITAISAEGLAASASLYSWIMLRGIDRNLKIARVFDKFGELGERWYDEFQSDDMPGIISVALLAEEVVDAHDKRDLALFRECVEDLKRIVTDFVSITNAYCSEVESDFSYNA